MTNRLADFGLRVRILREKRQLTLESLASRAHLDPAALGLIERGRRNPTLLTIWKIADGLGIIVDDLFAEKK